jgi:hypothetical protein
MGDGGEEETVMCFLSVFVLMMAVLVCDKGGDIPEEMVPEWRVTINRPEKTHGDFGSDPHRWWMPPVEQPRLPSECFEALI